MSDFAWAFVLALGIILLIPAIYSLVVGFWQKITNSYRLRRILGIKTRCKKCDFFSEYSWAAPHSDIPNCRVRRKTKDDRPWYSQKSFDIQVEISNPAIKNQNNNCPDYHRYV